jgi:hypothetical protein
MHPLILVLVGSAMPVVSELNRHAADASRRCALTTLTRVKIASGARLSQLTRNGYCRPC